MENRAQAITAAPAGSPCWVAKAYPAAVDSRKTNARKTKILVKTPGGWVSAFVPQAWNSEMTMRTMVPAVSFSSGKVTHSRGTARREGGRRAQSRAIPGCCVRH